MSRSRIARTATLVVVGLGASALTLVILFVPDLGAATLAALVAARVALGIARWGLAFLYGRRWLNAGGRRLHLVPAAP